MYDNAYTKAIIIEIKVFDAIKQFAFYSEDGCNGWFCNLNANNRAGRRTIFNMNFGHKHDVQCIKVVSCLHDKVIDEINLVAMLNLIVCFYDFNSRSPNEA